MQTKVYQGYGTQMYMDGGAMPMGGDPMMGGDPSQEMAPPASPEGGMAELQPMVQAYMSNPDPALAEEIIMSLANAMGMAPAMPPQAPAPAGGDPMAAMGGGGGAPAPFQDGGKIAKYLTGLKLK